MPLNTSTVAQLGPVGAIKNSLLDNNIAAAFGLNSNNDNLLQFHNRFGANSVFLPDKKTFIIRTQNYFSVSFEFMPAISKVLNLFSTSLMEKTADDLTYFIQEISLPNIRSSNNSQTGTGFIEGPIPGHIVIPTARVFDISFLNTEFSLHEHCFYYWLKETTSNTWLYVKTPSETGSGALECKPFTKADIHISFTSMKNNEKLHSIILTDCFPIEIKMPAIDQKMEPVSPWRTVTFAFNNIYVSSPFVGKNWQKKLKTNVIEDVFNSYLGNAISDKIGLGISSVSNKFNNGVLGDLAARQ